MEVVLPRLVNELEGQGDVALALDDFQKAASSGWTDVGMKHDFATVFNAAGGEDRR